MFDSLKSKLKNIFKKGNDLNTESVYAEPEPVVEEHSTPPTGTVQEEKKEISPEPIEQVEVPQETSQIPQNKPIEPVKEEVKEESKPAEVKPTPAPTPTKVEKPVSGKKKRSSDMMSTSVLGKKIKDDPLDDILDELEVTLLESDVAYPVVQEIIVGVRNNLAGKKYGREYSLEEVVELAVKEAVSDVLQINVFDFDSWLKEQKRPTVVMFIGINGTGKTTAIAKIANRLKQQNYTTVLAACDTFRAGAIEQLNIHAENINTKIIKSTQDADPASVAYDAIEHARSKMKDVVLIDTAGRMQTNNNLIAEMKKIAKVAKPDLKIFVGDSLAGNDAVEQAKVFDEAVGIDAIILTKIDTDAKGGAALSIAKTIGKPIAFVCNGQEYEDIEKFDADWMLNRLFD